VLVEGSEFVKRLKLLFKRRSGFALHLALINNHSLRKDVSIVFLQECYVISNNLYFHMSPVFSQQLALWLLHSQREFICTVHELLFQIRSLEFFSCAESVIFRAFVFM
jgi:hypothetical protein